MFSRKQKGGADAIAMVLPPPRFLRATGAKTQQVECVYDAFDQLTGKRVATQFNSSGTPINWSRYEVFAWADGQEVLRFVDSDGQGTAQPARVANRYLSGAAVDQMLADEQYTLGTGPAVTATTASTVPGNTLWALTDHLGSVRDLVDNNGVIREHNVYDSFGRLVREVDYNAAGQVIASTDPAAVDTLFGYTSRLFDPHTSLQYNRARWYDASTGRWLSQDPIGLGPDVNMYRYVLNSPANWTDPSGLEPPGGTGPTTPGTPTLPNQVPPNPAGNPHSGPTSGNGIVQNEGKAAHRDFGKGTKLPNGQITDRLQDKPNKLIVNELKPESRLQNNSKLKLAEKQLEKQMQGAQQLQPDKTICGRLWGWTKDAGGKVKYVVVSRWEYVAEKKGGKWAAKKIPFVGIAVGLWGWGGDVQAKGAVYGSVNSGLDMIPFVGVEKGVVEVCYGDDIIPDKGTEIDE